MKTIQLTKGLVALVDDKDYEELSKYKWYAHWNKLGKTYVARRTAHDGKKTIGIRMHRQIMGVTDPRIQIDHANACTLDNRRENLRVTTNSGNERNKRKRKGCASKYKGVSLNRDKWRARISIPTLSGFGDGKRLELGSFDREIDAALAYDKAAKIHHSVFAKLNFAENQNELRKLA